MASCLWEISIYNAESFNNNVLQCAIKTAHTFYEVRVGLDLPDDLTFVGAIHTSVFVVQKILRKNLI